MKSSFRKPGTAGEPETPTESVALPPETLEGWYALHQTWRLDRAAWRALAPEERRRLTNAAAATLARLTTPTDRGWSAIVNLVGATEDVMVLHFRATLDELGDAQREFNALELSDWLTLESTFLSVTEAGMYHLSARLAKEATARGGSVGDVEYRTAMEQALVAEREGEHARRRLYPSLPEGMPYVCFYPMDKRREAEQNWYTLPLEERSRLMYGHGTTGRRYAGQVMQVITGAIGFDAWEWGVTLFARDPLSFKKLVTEMRFDEASAKYAEFGEFWVGKLTTPGEWLSSLAAIA